MIALPLILLTFFGLCLACFWFSVVMTIFTCIWFVMECICDLFWFMMGMIFFWL